MKKYKFIIAIIFISLSIYISFDAISSIITSIFITITGLFYNNCGFEPYLQNINICFLLLINLFLAQPLKYIIKYETDIIYFSIILSFTEYLLIHCFYFIVYHNFCFELTGFELFWVKFTVLVFGLNYFILKLKGIAKNIIRLTIYTLFLLSMLSYFIFLQSLNDSKNQSNSVKQELNRQTILHIISDLSYSTYDICKELNKEFNSIYVPISDLLKIINTKHNSTEDLIIVIEDIFKKNEFIFDESTVRDKAYLLYNFDDNFFSRLLNYSSKKFEEFENEDYYTVAFKKNDVNWNNLPAYDIVFFVKYNNNEVFYFDYNYKNIHLYEENYNFPQDCMK